MLEVVAHLETFKARVNSVYDVKFFRMASVAFPNLGPTAFPDPFLVLPLPHLPTIAPPSTAPSRF